MRYLLIIFFTLINCFASYKVNCAEHEAKILPKRSTLVVALDSLMSKAKDEQISYFQKIDHLVNPKESAQITKQEETMNAYYADVRYCLDFQERFSASDSDCASDILYHCAVLRKNMTVHFLETLKQLYTYNADFFSKKVSSCRDVTLGEELLERSVYIGTHNLVSFLLKFGVNPQHCNSNRISMLQLAIMHNRHEVVRVLAHEGNVISFPKSTASPIMYAFNNCAFKTAEVLITHGGIAINKIDGYDNSPLIQSVKAGREDLVRLLLERNALVNQKDSNGRTAAMHAVSHYKAIALLEILFQYEADINVLDNAGLSIVDHALNHCRETQSDGSHKTLTYLLSKKPALSPSTDTALFNYFTYR